MKIQFGQLAAIAAMTALLCAPSAIAQQAPLPIDTAVSSPATTDRDDSADARYRLQRGDVVELNFPFVPTFNQTLTIQPDGYVTLHALGPLQVDGLTVAELTEKLRSGYVSVLRDPVVTVHLKDFEKPYFIVSGEVERPGKYDLRGVTTVTQAVAIAGGLRDRAKQSRAVVFRRQRQGGFVATTLDLKKMLKDERLSTDVRLAPGDMLFIPRGPRVNVAQWMSSLWIVTLF